MRSKASSLALIDKPTAGSYDTAARLQERAANSEVLVRRSFFLVLLPLLLLVPSRTAQASGFWDWMQEWSGPGPFVGKGHHPPVLVNLCSDAYREVGSRADSPSCLYFDVRWLEMEDTEASFRTERTPSALSPVFAGA